MAEKLGHNWLLNSTQLILKFSELPDWLVDFQLS
jgi:hypothetical protein